MRIRIPGILGVATSVALTAAAPLRASDEPPTATQPAVESADEKPLSIGMHPATQPSAGPQGFVILPEPGFLFWPTRAPLEGTIATDRPGFSDTTAVIPRGHIQLESGYTYTYDKGPDRYRIQVQDLPELSLRIGVLNNLEARIGWTGWVSTRTQYEGETRAGRKTTFLDKYQGGSDMKVGFKWALTRQDGLIPNLSLIPSLYLPTGSTDGLTTHDVDPEVRIAYSWAATPKWTIYGVAQLSSISYFDDDGDKRRYFQSGASLASGYMITDKLCGILEYYFLAPQTPGSDCSHNLNICSTYLITDNVQFDIRVGFGLNEEAPNFSTSAGLCFRW